MEVRFVKALGSLVVVVALAAAAAGCGGGSDDPLTVYSGREEELVAPLLEQFTEETGIDVEVRYGDSAELAATIAEEGENSPADVFFAQDPGSLGSVDARARLSCPRRLSSASDAQFRDADGRWVGTSGRSRVIAYNTDALSEDEVPDSVVRPHGSALEGSHRGRADERVVPGVRHRDATLGGRRGDAPVARRSQEERPEGVREERR